MRDSSQRRQRPGRRRPLRWRRRRCSPRGPRSGIWAVCLGRRRRRRNCGPGPSLIPVSEAWRPGPGPDPGAGFGPRGASPSRPGLLARRSGPLTTSFVCSCPQGPLPSRPPPTGRPSGPASSPPLEGPGQKMVQKKTAEFQGFHHSFKVRVESGWGHPGLDHPSGRWGGARSPPSGSPGVRTRPPPCAWGCPSRVSSALGPGGSCLQAAGGRCLCVPFKPQLGV